MRIVPLAGIPATAAARVVKGHPLGQTSQLGEHVPSALQAVTPAAQQPSLQVMRGLGQIQAPLLH